MFLISKKQNGEDWSGCQWNKQVNVHILEKYIIVMLVYFHIENEAFTKSLIKNSWSSLFSIWKQRYRIEMVTQSRKTPPSFEIAKVNKKA